MKNTIKTLENRRKELFKDLKDRLTKDNIKVNVRFSWKTLEISLTDEVNQWSDDYFRVKFTKGDKIFFNIFNSTGGWNDGVTGEQQIETLNKIFLILNSIKEDKKVFEDALLELIDIEEKIYKAVEDEKRIKKENFIKELVDEDFKILSTKELNKFLKENLGKELLIKTGNVDKQTVETLQIKCEKINNRYKIIESENGTFALVTWVNYFSGKLLKF